MRAYLGFIPLAVVGAPFIVACIRQTLFYNGCMDGMGYVLVAMLAFIVGGVLNVAYLVFVAATRRSHFSFANRRQAIVASWGFFSSILLLIVQAVILTCVILHNSMG